MTQQTRTAVIYGAVLVIGSLLFTIIASRIHEHDRTVVRWRQAPPETVIVTLPSPPGQPPETVIIERQTGKTPRIVMAKESTTTAGTTTTRQASPTTRPSTTTTTQALPVTIPVGP